MGGRLSSQEDESKLSFPQQNNQTGMRSNHFLHNSIQPQLYFVGTYIHPTSKQKKYSPIKAIRISPYNQLQIGIKGKLSKLQKQEYEHIDIEQELKEVLKAANTNIEVSQSSLKLHATFLFQAAKFYYYRSEYQKSRELIKELLRKQDALKVCKFQIVNLLVFDLFCAYLIKEQKGQTTPVDYAELVQLYNKIVNNKFKNYDVRQILIVSNSLIYHFKQKCQIKMLQLSAQLRQKCQIEFSKINQSKLMIEKDLFFIGVCIEIQNFQEHRISLKSSFLSKNEQIRNQTEQGRQIYIKKKLKDLQNHFKEHKIDFKSLTQLSKQKDIYYFEENDVKAIILAFQQSKTKKIKIQLPFFNLKAIFVQPTALKNWLGIYSHKKFTAFDIKVLIKLLPISVGVFLQSSLSCQTNKITHSQTANNKNKCSLSPNPNQITPQKINKIKKQQQNSDYLNKNSFNPQNLVIQSSAKIKYRPQNKGRGLKNLGNTCYMNSVLQCLHKSYIFNQAFTQIFQQLPSNKQQYFPLTYCYKQLIKQLSNQAQSRPYTPQKIKQVVSDYNNIFKYYRPHDPVQFISTFLEKISEQLNTSRKKPTQGEIDQKLSDQNIYQQQKRKNESRCKSIVEETLIGMYKTSYKCGQCHKKYRMFQAFKVHSVPIPLSNQTTQPAQYLREYQLEKCLQDFQDPQILQGNNTFPCDWCKKDTLTIKIKKIYEANKIIIISLKRFNNGKKNDKKIRIPSELNPSNLIFKQSPQKYNGQIYMLYAAIIHRSQIKEGHYSAICLDKNEWKIYDDSEVTVIPSIYQIQSELQNAYVLFYELQR